MSFSLSNLNANNYSTALRDNQPRRRTGSQVLKHAVKFGLRRSQTTKVAASEPAQSSTLCSSASFPRRCCSLTKEDNNQCSNKLEISSEDHLVLTKAGTIQSVDYPLPKSPSPASHQQSIVIAYEQFRPLVAIPEHVRVEERHTKHQPDLGSSPIEPQYYRAFLSSIAVEMKKRIVPTDRIKNGIEYVNVFDGKKAIDVLTEILYTTDRMLALTIGQALEAQRFFHDVNYEKRLIDDVVELYQFNDLLFHGFNNARLASTSSYGSTTDNSTLAASATSTTINTLLTDFENTVLLAEDDDRTSVKTDSTAIPHYRPMQQQTLGTLHSTLPNGVYTYLTYCYSPTCDNINPCYSYTCPRRSDFKKRNQDTLGKQSYISSTDTATKHELWSHTVDDYIVISLPVLERKRQETIFELIYTEENFCNDLEYVIKMWIEPLQRKDIIPKRRRKAFVNHVFSNLIAIRDISRRLTLALRERQSQHPIVATISDVLEPFISEFSSFVEYGANQHYAKYVYESERCTNVQFAHFAEQTEKNKASRKLELNGYLTKPTSRLGRYTLLLDRIYDCTAPNHIDKVQLPIIIEKIKELLQQVNEAAGEAMNRFHLKQMHSHLSFKNKRDVMDMHLLNPSRRIVKQGVLRKTANLDSTEYRLILLDNYLVVTKVKRVMTTEYFCIQRRPIPIELLDMTDSKNIDSRLYRKLSTTSLLLPISPSSPKPSYQHQSEYMDSQHYGYPICFKYYGKNVDDTFILYAPNEPNRNTWIEVIQQQQNFKLRRAPVFIIAECAKRYEFFADIKASHMVLFDNGNQFMLATEAGLYVGPNRSAHSGIPRKILPLEKLTQIHVLEEFGLLLVLADHTLWQYPLDIVINARPDGYESMQHFGRKIRMNVPFFHVGICLDQTIICIPNSLSVNGTEIELYTPTMPKTEVKKKSFFERLSIKSTSLSLVNTQVTALKPIYTPSEVWAIDNTRSMILLTTPVGVIAVDIRTKKAEGLLDPTDQHLEFITKTEKIDEQIKLNKTVKRIAVFSTSDGHYLICYDRFAFYIDKKGRRAHHDFKIEWEGHPTAFAYHHPYVIAFESHFIEIRDITDGQLRQVVHGKNMYCLENGHKSKSQNILATMQDPTDPAYQFIFELQPVPYS